MRTLLTIFSLRLPLWLGSCMDNDTIGIVLVAAGAVVLIAVIIVGLRRSVTREAPAEEPFVGDPSYDMRDEVEQNLSAIRRMRGETDL